MKNYAKNIPLTNLIEQTVLDQMRTKASFTALDISNQLKFERYPVQHGKVAETVREIYQSGAMAFYDYERELIPVVTECGRKQTQAFLYHFQEVRPRTYQTRTQDALPPPLPGHARDLADSVHASPIPVLHRPAHPARTTPRSSRRRTRRDGALGIPRQILTQLGWSDGLTLTLTHENGALTAAPQSASPVSAPSSLRVWRGQRLRICRTKLSLGALSADNVTVEIDGDKLKLGSE